MLKPADEARKEVTAAIRQPSNPGEMRDTNDVVKLRSLETVDDGLRDLRRRERGRHSLIWQDRLLEHVGRDMAGKHQSRLDVGTEIAAGQLRSDAQPTDSPTHYASPS